jgi:hypothetical protein
MLRKFLALFFVPPAAKLEQLSDADKEQYETLCYTNDGVQVYVRMKVHAN